MKLAFWIARRLAAVAAQLFVISFLAFSMLFITPGSAVQLLLGTNPATPETIAAIERKYHLDEPFFAQYGRWLANALQGDFGTSIRSGQSVLEVLGAHSVLTLQLSLMAFALVALTAVPLGVISGVREGTFVDRTITSISTVAISAPSFATGTILLYVFAVALGWFPSFGRGEGLWDTIVHLTLPAITLALSVIALVQRQTRALARTVARSDFVLFARARGVRRRTVWTRYLLRNSSLPTVTSLGLILAYFLTGAVIVEQTFSLNGLGSLLVSSVSTKDVPVVQAAVVLGGLLILLSNLAADASYMMIDPRVRRKVLS